MHAAWLRVAQYWVSASGTNVDFCQRGPCQKQLIKLFLPSTKMFSNGQKSLRLIMLVRKYTNIKHLKIHNGKAWLSYGWHSKILQWINWVLILKQFEVNKDNIMLMTFAIHVAKWTKVSYKARNIPHFKWKSRSFSSGLHHHPKFSGVISTRCSALSVKFCTLGMKTRTTQESRRVA